jgi:hypothetical protein
MRHVVHLPRNPSEVQHFFIDHKFVVFRVHSERTDREQKKLFDFTPPARLQCGLFEFTIDSRDARGN